MERTVRLIRGNFGSTVNPNELPAQRVCLRTFYDEPTAFAVSRYGVSRPSYVVYFKTTDMPTAVVSATALLDDVRAQTATTGGPHQRRLLSAFCPRPGHEEPVGSNFSKRDCIDRAKLDNLLTAKVKGHRCRSNDVGVVAVHINVLWLA